MSSFHPPRPRFKFRACGGVFNPPTSVWGGDSGGISPSIYKFLRRGGERHAERWRGRSGRPSSTLAPPSPLHPNAHAPAMTERVLGPSCLCHWRQRLSPLESSASSSFGGVRTPTRSPAPAAPLPIHLGAHLQEAPGPLRGKRFPPEFPVYTQGIDSPATARLTDG